MPPLNAEALMPTLSVPETEIVVPAKLITLTSPLP